MKKEKEKILLRIGEENIEIILIRLVVTLMKQADNSPKN